MIYYKEANVCPCYHVTIFFIIVTMMTKFGIPVTGTLLGVISWHGRFRLGDFLEDEIEYVDCETVQI